MGNGSKPALVVMAAGMGSRYGGLKQIDPVDEYGNIIMDFSIFDAKEAGFEKVVFIIKKAIEKEFKEKSLQEKDVFKQLKLKGLDILEDFNGKTYSQLEVESTDYINNLDNQSIRTIVIKNWPDEAFLYTVFLRLNTGSKKLSPQELRQALKPGPFLDFLDDETANSEVIKNMLNNKSADPRMKDIELALRYFAFKCFADKYEGNLKEFLDYTCENLNKSWEKNEKVLRELFKELENAILYLTDLFTPNSAFSRYTKGKCNGRFNRSIYEVLTYYFSIKEIRFAIDKKKKEFVEEFARRARANARVWGKTSCLPPFTVRPCFGTR